MSERVFTGKICPICREKIFTETIKFMGLEFEHELPCTCRQKAEELEKQQAEIRKNEEILRRRLIASKIPERYYAASFESFVTNGNNQTAKEKMRRYAEKFPEYYQKGMGIYLHGNCGSGKTYLACAAAHVIMAQGYGVMYQNASDICDETSANFGVLPDVYKNATLLILDDLGAESENKSDSRKATIYKLIDCRYRGLKPTIITSNLKFQELEALFDTRISERILENTLKITLAAESFRRRKDKR